MFAIIFLYMCNTGFELNKSAIKIFTCIVIFLQKGKTIRVKPFSRQCFLIPKTSVSPMTAADSSTSTNTSSSIYPSPKCCLNKQTYGAIFVRK